MIPPFILGTLCALTALALAVLAFLAGRFVYLRRLANSNARFDRRPRLARRWPK